MTLIDRVILLRKLLKIDKPNDLEWYLNSDFQPDYYLAIIDLYLHYCKVQLIDTKPYKLLYEVSHA